MKKKQLLWLYAFITAIMCVGLTSCGDDDEGGVINVPVQEKTIESIGLSDITYIAGDDELSVQAYLVPSGGRAVLTVAPLIGNDAVAQLFYARYDTENMRYTFSLSSLTYDVTYVCTIAVYDKKGNLVRQSVEMLVTVKAPEVTVNRGNAPDYVENIDLGLPSGTMWANVNMGAVNPEDYGLMYAWGETVGWYSLDTNNDGQANDGQANEEHSFTLENYRWYQLDSERFVKYCTTSVYGAVDGKSVLEAADDVATAMWGGDWRMPTLDDVKELINNTTSENTVVNGIYGRRFTSKINGQSIFMPAAGYRKELEIKDQKGQNVSGYFWTSTLRVSNSNYAYIMSFDRGNVYSGTNDRYIGQSVRAVIK